MKRLLIIFALLGRMFANQCSDHNIYLSSTATTVSKTGAAMCTAGTVGGVNYGCASGGMTVWGFDIQSPCDTNWVSYAVQAPDNTGSNKYDLGLYYITGPSAGSLAGRLMVHLGSLPGSSFAQSPGLQTKSWVAVNCSMPCTLPAGQYALALATDCSGTPPCAALWGDDNKGYMYLFDVWLGGNGGTGVNPGLLPAGCPSGNPPACNFNMATAPGLPTSITTLTTDPGLWRSGYPRPPAILIF